MKPTCASENCPTMNVAYTLSASRMLSPQFSAMLWRYDIGGPFALVQSRCASALEKRPLRANDQNREKNDEEDGFLHRSRDHAHDRRLDHAHEDPADHRAIQAAEAGENDDDETGEQQAGTHVRADRARRDADETSSGARYRRGRGEYRDLHRA
jgi:hypothetical protein